MIHNIKFRVFVYENESIDDINQAILNLLPEAEIEVEEAEGLLEDKILILSVRLPPRASSRRCASSSRGRAGGTRPSRRCGSGTPAGTRAAPRP